MDKRASMCMRVVARVMACHWRKGRRVGCWRSRTAPPPDGGPSPARAAIVALI